MNTNKLLVMVAMALCLCMNTMAQGFKLSGGGASSGEAGKFKLELKSLTVTEDIGGEVGAGREIKFFAKNAPTEDAAQKAMIAANVGEVRAGHDIGSDEYYVASDFTHEQTKIIIFDFYAGTNSTVPASGIEFEIMSTDVSATLSNLWKDTIKFDISQGYSTDTFVGEKEDGSLHPDKTPVTFKSRRITGALELKYLAETDEGSVNWFNGYVDFTNPEIRLMTKIKNVPMPDFVLRRMIPSILAVNVATNGNITLTIGVPENDPNDYTLQATTNVGDAGSWQDVMTIPSGQTSVPWGNTADGAMKFARLVYKP